MSTEFPALQPTPSCQRILDYIQANKDHEHEPRIQYIGGNGARQQVVCEDGVSTDEDVMLTILPQSDDSGLHENDYFLIDYSVRPAIIAFVADIPVIVNGIRQPRDMNTIHSALLGFMW